MPSPALSLSALLAVASLATAQTCLTSPFVGGNGGNPGGAVFYTVDVTPVTGLTLTTMDLNLDSATIGSVVGCEVYIRIGVGHSGLETTPGWALAAVGTGTMAGSGSPSTMTFSSPLWLPVGTSAVAVVATGGASHDYTNGTGANQTVLNADLTMTLGSASNEPFSSTPFSPRVANTTLCYNLGGGTSYPWFTVSAAAGVLPLFVDFTDSSMSADPNGIALWQWDFESDGIIDVQGSGPAEQNPQWIFGAPGDYSVTLTIVDTYGANSRTRTDLIHVGAPTNNTDSADLLHYVFNEPPRAGDLRAFNAASTDVAPRFGTMTNDLWQGDPARPGFQGSEPGFGCLGEAGVISSNAVDTGLALDVNDMTIAWWHRIGQTGASTSNAFAYVFGGPSSSQRCFIDGAAGNGLLRYAGTNIGNFNTVTDVKSSLADQWTHIALTVDDTTGIATWYINGVVDTTLPFAPGQHDVNRSEFWVGYHSGTQNYSLFYSMDDFRLYSRALSASEVAALAAGAEPAVSTLYGTGCDGAGGIVPTLASSGGPPAVGNAFYAVELNDIEPNTFGGFIFGTQANQLAGGGALPVPLAPLGLGFGSACNLEVGGFTTLQVGLQTTGSLVQQLPIPANPLLAGEHFYVQGLVLGSVFAVGDVLDISIQ